MAGCWAFLFGSMAPAVLGWMSQRFTLRTGFVSLTAFVSIGAVLLVIARIAFLRRDMETVEKLKG
jgi:sugar phosphate permease